MVHSTRTPVWSWLLPLAGLLLFGVATASGFGDAFASDPVGIATAVLLVPALIGAVFAAVYHAEDVAHITGEPIGTLVLTIAVTVIELALIVSLMLTGKATPTLVRDTVFAVIMIVTTGLVGLCILVGGLRYREQTFDVTSAKIYLAMLIVLTTLTIILPNYTSSAPEHFYSEIQLVFISIATVALYLVFLFTQTVLHRDYFTGERNAPKEVPARKGKLLTASLLLMCGTGGRRVARQTLRGRHQCRRFGDRRASGCDRRHHCTDRADAGGNRRRHCREPRQSAEEPQSGPGLVSRNDRADHSGHRCGQHHSAKAAHSRSRASRSGPRHDDARGQHSDLWNRPDERSFRIPASRDLRDVSFLRFCPVTSL